MTTKKDTESKAKDEKRDSKDDMSSEELAKIAIDMLADKMGINPVLLDVREHATVTDFFVVVSGNNKPHLKAMFEDVLHGMKAQGVMAYRKVGDHESGWLVLDYIDVVIHILIDDQREYYGIEDLWREPPQIEEHLH